jgi:hypothetical protein
MAALAMAGMRALRGPQPQPSPTATPGPAA